jgi:hypothetical protein
MSAVEKPLPTSSFEKLGVFYLGRTLDPAAPQEPGNLLLYDSRDLTTHAVCVGMTGSGKTGLCISLLEEAALDGVPAIAIDPKGDLGNLLLTFPELRPSDFRPWIDEGDAARKGRTPEEHAEKTAEKWREGLASWGEDGARIRALRQAVDLAIYTPGGTAGLPLAALRSFSAPSTAVRNDEEALRDRVSAAASGLLSLVGLESDPLSSREHILVATLLEDAWRQGRDLDLASLIRGVQEPGFDSIGVMDVESFYPSRERFALAMKLNGILASPGFAAWTEGEPLDVARLLWTEEGRPRISVVHIAHLDDAERMFFVTLLLNEVLAWARAQSGTSSLRAILYMDEVFGFFPPTRKPPSKPPMLTLLKQARAFGLGVVLATQNPVDLDYKGLSNAGTWFLGRLQTQRDKDRVLDGLEGVSGRSALDRRTVDRTLSGLESRMFLMHNVHEDEPVVFRTRWAMSYLRGPLVRSQIRYLMEGRVAVASDATAPGGAAAGLIAEGGAGEAIAAPGPEVGSRQKRPALPAGIAEVFLPMSGGVSGGSDVVYRPALLGTVDVRYARARTDLDEWRRISCLAPLEPTTGGRPWDAGRVLEEDEPEWLQDPGLEGGYASLPAAAARPASYPRWESALRGFVYRSCPLRLWRCPEAKLISRPGESDGDFRIRVRESAREARDERLEKIRKRYGQKLVRADDRVLAAERRLAGQKDQYSERRAQSVLRTGESILGALLGRKVLSSTNVRRASASMRSARQTARERDDVERAEERLREAIEKRDMLAAEFEDKIAAERGSADDAALTIEELLVAPRKSEISVRRLALAWVPEPVTRA